MVDLLNQILDEDIPRNEHFSGFTKNGCRYDFRGAMMRASKELWNNYEMWIEIVEALAAIIEWIAERVSNLTSFSPFSLILNRFPFLDSDVRSNIIYPGSIKI